MLTGIQLESNLHSIKEILLLAQYLQEMQIVYSAPSLCALAVEFDFKIIILNVKPNVNMQYISIYEPKS